MFTLYVTYCFRAHKLNRLNKYSSVKITKVLKCGQKAHKSKLDRHAHLMLKAAARRFVCFDVFG